MKQLKKQISDWDVIAGLFREALFHGRSIEVDIDGRTTEARLVEVLEPSARGSQESRKLRLVSQTEIQLVGATSAASAKCKCAFPHFVASWVAKYSAESATCLLFNLPEVVTVENQRDHRRVRPAGLTEKAIPVLLSTNGKYVEGSLLLENHSEAGCGGALNVLSSFEIAIGTKIEGLLRAPHGNYRVNGYIVQSNLISAANSSNKENQLRVGISSYREPVKTPDNTDRRKSSRVKSEFPVVLLSPLSPDHAINVDVQSASASGFLGKLKDPSDASFLSLALAVRVKDTSILAEVVGQDKELIRFQLITGEPEDRLKWLGRLARSRPGVSVGTATGMDVIDLFCGSGAFSSKFIAEQSRFANDILVGLVADELNEAWVHRWIERTPSGEIKGHSSAIRIADQLWHIGDIAGMRQSDRKISRDFVASFFRIFRDYCLSLKPCPKVVISWTEGHPYWSGFEKHIAKCSGDEVFSVRADYFRVHSSDVLHEPNCEFRSIEAQEHGVIDGLLSQCTTRDVRRLLEVLDFSVSTFGSPNLERILRGCNLQFQRSYAVLDLGGSKFVVVFSMFPLGVCPQRSIEVPWIIPMSERIPRREIPALVSAVKAYGLKNGFQIPGVLVARGGGNTDSGDSTKSMVWTVAHPSVLSFFGRRDE